MKDQDQLYADLTAAEEVVRKTLAEIDQALKSAPSREAGGNSSPAKGGSDSTAGRALTTRRKALDSSKAFRFDKVAVFG